MRGLILVLPKAFKGARKKAKNVYMPVFQRIKLQRCFVVVSRLSPLSLVTLVPRQKRGIKWGIIERVQRKKSTLRYHNSFVTRKLRKY